MATFNIYCDESCHLERDGAKAMVLGCVWAPRRAVRPLSYKLRDLKVKHGLSRRFETKWVSVSPAKFAFYREVVDFFFSEPDLHFRAVVVPDKAQLRHKDFKQTHDDFLYKIYFTALSKILDPKNDYHIYLDIKDTKSAAKIRGLQDYLGTSVYDFDRSIIHPLQSVRSHEVELLQLADLLIGAIGYVHRGLTTSKAKSALVRQLQHRSGYTLMRNTLVREDKLNVLVWSAS